MAHKGNKKKKAFEFMLGNSLTISNVNSVYAEIMEKYDEHGHLKIRSETIEQIDLTGIQLIAHLQQLGENFNAEFHLKFHENTRDLLSKCGFENVILT
ncbi:MAG: hypothetical protein IPM71_03180 [Bacteroidota bacterium]|nr:MAG: hypothetical protein IPM71_03180 [Bacteroidota bacterium]